MVKSWYQGEVMSEIPVADNIIQTNKEIFNDIIGNNSDIPVEPRQKHVESAYNFLSTNDSFRKRVLGNIDNQIKNINKLSEFAEKRFSDPDDPLRGLVFDYSNRMKKLLMRLYIDVESVKSRARFDKIVYQTIMSVLGPNDRGWIVGKIAETEKNYGNPIKRVENLGKEYEDMRKVAIVAGEKWINYKSGSPEEQLFERRDAKTHAMLTFFCLDLIEPITMTDNYNLTYIGHVKAVTALNDSGTLESRIRKMIGHPSFDPGCYQQYLFETIGYDKLKQFIASYKPRAPYVMI
jgi:hypothetical protein